MRHKIWKWIGIVGLMGVLGIGVIYTLNQGSAPRMQEGDGASLPASAGEELSSTGEELSSTGAELSSAGTELSSAGPTPYTVTETEAKNAGTVIELSQGQTTVRGAGAAVQDNKVLIQKGGVYRLTGTLTDGQIYVEVDGDETVALVLDGVTVSNPDGPAIYVENAQNTAIYLMAGTDNVISSGEASAMEAGEADENASGGAVYLRDDATVCGEGSLAVYGYINNGIHCSNHLFIESGDLSVVALNHGIKGKDSLTVEGGTISVESCQDAIHSDIDVTVIGGTLVLSAGDDGIHADNSLVIYDGDISILQSYEGLESSQVTIHGGTVSLYASDDGINASEKEDEEADSGSSSAAGGGITLPTLTVNGGTLYVNAGGDGLDSNGDLTINGGSVVIDGPVSGADGALDYGAEHGGSLRVNGGTVLALSSSGMAETFQEDSGQCSFAYRLPVSYQAGSGIVVLTADDTVLCRYTAQKTGDFIIFSDPSLSIGSTYRLSVDDEEYEITLTGTTTLYGDKGGFGGGKPGRGPGGEAFPEGEVGAFPRETPEGSGE